MKSNFQQNIDFIYLEMQKRWSLAINDSPLSSTDNAIDIIIRKCLENYWVWDHLSSIRNFCWCQLQTYNLLEEKPDVFKLSTNMHAPQCDFENSNYSNLNLSTESNNKGPLPNIRSTLVRILQLVDNWGDISFSHWNKSQRGFYHGISKRRSSFIGVSKNGRRYQVLINEGRTKKYIGTFSSELEAATVHDFYAIGINGRKAKTNFSYDCEQVIAMIRSYFKNDEYFDAKLFMPKSN